MSNNYSAACKELIEEASPERWLSYLFDLQNSLIAKNYFEGYSREGFQEHANYFQALKDFFTTLQTKK